MSATADLLADLGEEIVLVGDAAARHVHDERGLFSGEPAAVVFPRDTAEVARAVVRCRELGLAVVPQGGGTGLVGGAVPRGQQREVLLNLGRMNRIRRVRPEDFSMEVEAGCVLADVQAAAAEHDRLFPLSLGAEGSCQIGGNIATNAGGINVVRYGNTRDLVLGLEVVLADGQVWNGMRALRKDNTGYDLKQLFIGSEGTLGVITAACLRLFPAQNRRMTAMLALPGLDVLADALALARSTLDDRISSLELLPGAGIDLVVEHVPDTHAPLADRHGHYLLVEITSSGDAPLRESMLDFLDHAVRRKIAVDAAVAGDRADAARLWRLRSGLSEAQKRAGGAVKHDVSVRLSAVGEFITYATERVERAWPGAVVLALGHVGDGNVHFNVLPPPGRSGRDPELWQEINALVHAIVVEFDGSISAEHGVGRLKREMVAHHADPVELRLRRQIKQLFDPDDLLNPGKLVPEAR